MNAPHSKRATVWTNTKAGAASNELVMKLVSLVWGNNVLYISIKNTPQNHNHCILKVVIYFEKILLQEKMKYKQVYHMKQILW